MDVEAPDRSYSMFVSPRYTRHVISRLLVAVRCLCITVGCKFDRIAVGLYFHLGCAVTEIPNLLAGGGVEGSHFESDGIARINPVRVRNMGVVAPHGRPQIGILVEMLGDVPKRVALADNVIRLRLGQGLSCNHFLQGHDAEHAEAEEERGHQGKENPSSFRVHFCTPFLLRMFLSNPSGDVPSYLFGQKH